MPVVRICARCRKGFLCSTYQLIEHWKTCSPVLPKNASIETGSPADRPQIQNHRVRAAASADPAQFPNLSRNPPETLL